MRSPVLPSVGGSPRGNKISRLTLLLVLLLSLIAAGFQADWTLGRVAMARGPSSGPLTIRGSRVSLAGAGFLARVGGVAFIETAAPGPSVGNRRVLLSYVPGQPDGSRLLVTIGGESYRPYIPDWQLVPIAKFAASNHNAAVSLFGENSTEEFYEATFHPALENSLLGLRLLHADMLLMLPIEDASQLPRLNNALVLGAGERMPDQATASMAGTQVHETLRGNNWQSWVFTDRGENVRFGVSDGQFVITGEPYYLFWRYSQRGRTIQDSVQLVEERYNRTVGLYNQTLAALRRQPGSAALQRQFQAHDQSLQRDSVHMARLEAEFERAGTTTLSNLTAAMQRNGPTIRNLNPAVYDAARRTMRYSAFFRWVKRTNAANWTQFSVQLQGVRPRPPVQTPNRVPRNLD